MSKLEIRSIEEEIRNARIVGELERAEEKGIEKGREEGIKKGREEGIKKGIEKGIEEGRKEIIKKILETKTPEEASKLNIPLEEIQRCSNDK